MVEKSAISTEQTAGRGAFAFWQEVICDTFIHLDCVSANSPDFRGSLSSQPLGDLSLTAMESDPILLSRTRLRISAAREEYCLIVVQRRGRTVAEQDGRQTILETSDIAVFDSERPYSAELQTGFQHLVLKVPREVMRRRLGPVEAVTAIRVSGSRGLGKIASNFVRGLHSELDSLEPSIAQHLAQTSVDLIAAALADVLPSATRSASSTRVAHLMRAKSFIFDNVHRYDLTPEQVAQAIGVSERYLRDLFATIGTSPARFVWSYRLERCRIALTDRLQAHRSISEIAFAWGFNDMSHFSKLFRDSLGMSPREYRTSAQLR